MADGLFRFSFVVIDPGVGFLAFPSFLPDPSLNRLNGRERESQKEKESRKRKWRNEGCTTAIGEKETKLPTLDNTVKRANTQVYVVGRRSMQQPKCSQKAEQAHSSAHHHIKRPHYR